MTNQDDYISGNRDYWNEVTSIHEKSRFYDVGSFKKGKPTIMPLEIKEIGKVKEKTLLHLQCHFGIDTISWERMGAQAIGVDLSDKSIETARRLAKELNSNVQFICSDIYKLPTVLNNQFDIVYSTGGVLCWLPDLDKWAKVVSSFVRPGGFFYLRDDHPFAVILDENLNINGDYFHQDKPIVEPPSGSYADPNATVTKCNYEWHHSLSDIIDSLIRANLKIDFFHEFPFLGWARFPQLMKLNNDGWYRFKEEKINMPLMFSLKATKQLTFIPCRSKRLLIPYTGTMSRKRKRK